MENWEQIIDVKNGELATEHRCGGTEKREQNTLGVEEENREQNIAVKNRELETEHRCGEKENREYNTDVEEERTKNETPLLGDT